MRFWDTSALVPLVSNEGSTGSMNALMQDDPNFLVSFLTPIELTSAISRRIRTADPAVKLRARGRITALEAGWTLLDDYPLILREALAVAARHRLRSGDAIQLASASTSRIPKAEIVFVTLDRDLAEAARAEGFAVLP